MDDSPQATIDRLDASLGRRGQPVDLRRYVSGSELFVDLPLRAAVRGYEAEQLVGGVKASDSRFVLSPSDIGAAAAWPGAAGGDKAPRIGDFLVVNGIERKIEAVQPVVIGATVVRYDGRILG